MKNIKDHTRVIGLIQMTSHNNSGQNLQAAIDSIREAAAKELKLFACLSYFFPIIFANQKIPKILY